MTTIKPSSDSLSSVNAAVGSRRHSQRELRYAELDAEFTRQLRKLEHLVERMKKRGLGRPK